MALIVAGCGTDGAGETTTTGGTSTTSTPPATTSLPMTTTSSGNTTTTTTAVPAGQVVYFMLTDLDPGAGPFLVPVFIESADAADPALTAVELLLSGPTPDLVEGTPAMATAIPEGTEALGVEVENGVATVDLTEEYDDGGGTMSMFARLAQVVYTLTRFPGIDGVLLSLEGEPVSTFSAEGIDLDGPQTRADYYDLMAPIFVDSPAWGEPVVSPIEVRGYSNVFEAVSQVMLTDDDGASLFEDTVMATCGTGCWGQWEIEIPYTVDRPQLGAIIVWEYSAQDGSRIHVREYPIQLR
jgi:germination protein M